MSLRSIVEVLGGDLYDGGRRASIPAPGHSLRDRSVSLMLDGRRLVVHGFGAADWREVMDWLRSRGLVDADGSVREGVGRVEAGRTSPASVPRPERVEAARRIWDSGLTVAGTLSERHARLRGVRRNLPGAEALRHASAAPLTAYRPGRGTRPALLAAIRDPLGELCGVEMTYLGADGRRAERLRLSRKTVGAVPAGAAVRLDPLTDRMLVAEGVFTALSASEQLRLPAWALLSASNLARWTAPAEVRSVVIAADRGQAGEAAAGRLAERLANQRVKVSVALPPEAFGDWNDAASAIQHVACESESQRIDPRPAASPPQPEAWLRSGWRKGSEGRRRRG